MLSNLYKWGAILLIVVAILFGVHKISYNEGIEHQKRIQSELVIKENVKVDNTNQQTQAVTDKTAEQQVIYRDKIVTQYKTITKEVVVYEKSEAANVGLDDEFVRLHNAAARVYDQAEIAQPTSGVNGETAPSGVTTGEAIKVITGNYEKYQQCARQVNGWIEYYTKLQETFNGR